MHSTNGDHAPRFGGMPELHSEKNIQSHDFPKLEDDIVAIDGSTTVNAHTIKPNEVSVPIPQDLGIPEVLDAVLVAWVLLLHRYERDAFHQFTWGIKETPKDQMQCISAVDLDLTNQNSIVNLRHKIENIRTASITADCTSTIFMKDGSSVEVRIAR
jgi:hypothetical protein